MTAAVLKWHCTHRSNELTIQFQSAQKEIFVVAFVGWSLMGDIEEHNHAIEILEQPTCAFCVCFNVRGVSGNFPLILTFRRILRRLRCYRGPTLFPVCLFPL